MKIQGGRELKPTMGYALVRRVRPERIGSILVPDVAPARLDGTNKGQTPREVPPSDLAHYEVIESSEGHYVDGQLVPSGAEAGDRVVLAPGFGAVEKANWGKGVLLVMLRDVVAVEHAAASKRRTA